MTRRTALTLLDWLELAFWVGLIAILALLVGLFRSRPMGAAHKPLTPALSLVADDDPDVVDPLADLNGILW